MADGRRIRTLGLALLTSGRPYGVPRDPPPWGKLHTLDAAYFSQAYPRFDDFVAIRDRLDPRRTFSNPYLNRVLG